MAVIAEEALSMKGGSEQMLIRLYAPEAAKRGPDWTCRFEVGSPINSALDIAGVSSLQALVLALKGLSAVLYSSEEYKRGELGLHGEDFGGFLGVPATSIFLDEAPYPF